jgi:hypothetical protein
MSAYKASIVYGVPATTLIDRVKALLFTSTISDPMSHMTGRAGVREADNIVLLLLSISACRHLIDDYVPCMRGKKKKL